MHIKSVSTFNIFGASESRTIELKSPVVIFTGYNGAGKSTLLGVIHSSLSVAKGQEYLFPKTDWGCKIQFADDVEFMHVKTSRILPDDFDASSTANRKIKGRDVLKEFYENIQKRFEGKETKNKLIVKREGDGRDPSSTNVMALRPPQMEAIKSWPSSVLYGDEVFSSKLDDLESKKFEDLDIFSKKKNLDKTFFLLQSEFASETKLGAVGSVTSELVSVIEQTIGIMKKIGTSNPKLQEQVSLLEKLRNSQVESNPFIQQANIFFASTKRELKVGAKGFLILSTAHGDVSWYDFSKGEKTLLCLLLVAYLARKEKTLFLLDEPDLSLHIRWQRQLLPSLKKLAPDAQFVVATHSPALVGQTDDEAVINIGAMSKG
ncbi:ATP-binding protein [Pseudomonas asiatica]|uniref:ATP-binding protein n=1 Tax=Pseudomonas asiatica TaxID=2219225 RepID=UPI0025AA85A9|nr:ATP-binding protein [Pseudomonas asiatica]MDM9555675.1 ATP-binding protein [Pseudomonas asiatica]